MTEPTYLSRGIAYLGDLGGKLRDLQGFKTLANELIQNADDATTATSMVFNITDDALIVENDGVFSDCQQMEKSECPWKTDREKNYRCDFHRFRIIASGDKRGQEDTTGAFGIGFIAVYQITDTPELISNGRHWVIHEENAENQRIQVCHGCTKCKSSNLPGTRFILPWAIDSESELRKALQVDAVSSNIKEELSKEFQASIPTSMLFLKRIRSIVIKLNNEVINSYERIDEGSGLIISSGNAATDRTWYTFQGNFTSRAHQLRGQFPNRIEEKRKATVTIAFSTEKLVDGVLCAYLPTEEETGLPFHINADFYPTNDRKHVILGADYQAEWNRAAIKAAAGILADNIEKLPELFKPKELWQFIEKIKTAHDNAKQQQEIFGTIWTEISSLLPEVHIVYTTNNKWVKSRKSVLLFQAEESPVIPILEELGLDVVHENLRPFQNIFREVLGISPLGIDQIHQALTVKGLLNRIESDALPSFINDESKQILLWEELDRLLSRQERNQNVKARNIQQLRELAIAPGRDGAFWPCRDLYLADEETITLFNTINDSIPYVSDRQKFFNLAKQLCDEFTVVDAIGYLENPDSPEFVSNWKANEIDIKAIISWFQDRNKYLCSDSDLVGRFKSLRIFPGADSLYPLDELTLPGGFQDHLGLAEFIDLSVLGKHQEFLRDLGMTELDFFIYARDKIAPAMENENISIEKKRAAVVLLAKKLGEIKDKSDIKLALASAHMIECKDGFYRAQDCYFNSQVVRNCLVGDINIVVVPEGNTEAVRDLYVWLGVEENPRIDDVITSIENISKVKYSPTLVNRVDTIIEYLAKLYNQNRSIQRLERLKQITWLPARGKVDRWYKPEELHAGFRYHIFESQALFLDISTGTRDSSRVFLENIGVHINPEPNLVTRHLLHCCDENIPAHIDIYRFLNENADKPIVKTLKDKKCLLLGDEYWKPEYVYWCDHPFGQYRRKLSPELKEFNKLFEALEISETLDLTDAKTVLLEISDSVGSATVDENTQSIIMACWRMMEQALDQEIIQPKDLADLRSKKTVLNNRNVLYPPEWMFFENKAGLTQKFGDFLYNNVINRQVGATKVMEVAGVRPISQAVLVELLECDDQVTDNELKNHILSRKNQLGRVIDTLDENDVSEALTKLDTIITKKVTRLKIRYSIDVFKQVRFSEPEEAPALYLSEQNSLLFVDRSGNPPWAAIARELAIALFPESDPGKTSSPFKEVLGADTPDLASTTLDELGFAQVDTEVLATPQAQTTNGLGVDSEIPEESGDYQQDQGIDLTPDEALTQLFGGTPTDPTPPVADTPGEYAGAGTSSDRHEGHTPSQGRPVLRSYVPGPKTNPPQDDDGAYQGITDIDKAGIHLVMEYERAQGRNPKEMAHNNPGYDIESRDAFGNVVRLIEVKSFSDKWNNTYAVLSRSQFDQGLESGELFWLYVVECANSDYAIFPIHAPVLLANHFMFDDGWRVLAEYDD